MKIFDTHTHTNIEPLINNFEEIYLQSQTKNVFFNVVGTTIQDSMIAIKQAQKDGVYCSVGIHPNDVCGYDIDLAIKELDKLIIQNRKKIIALGEFGLDYHYEGFNKQTQFAFFVEQLKLAKKHDLTLMLHIRDAHDDAIALLKKYKTKQMRIIIHCFSDKQKYAEEYLQMGCYLSISGVVTFKKSNELRMIVKQIPLELMLTETDAPFLSPVPCRGKTNYPYHVIHTNEFLANLLEVDLVQLHKQLYKNVLKAFNLAI